MLSILHRKVSLWIFYSNRQSCHFWSGPVNLVYHANMTFSFIKSYKCFISVVFLSSIFMLLYDTHELMNWEVIYCFSLSVLLLGRNICLLCRLIHSTNSIFEAEGQHVGNPVYYVIFVKEVLFRQKRGNRFCSNFEHRNYSNRSISNCIILTQDLLKKILAPFRVENYPPPPPPSYRI